MYKGGASTHPHSRGMSTHPGVRIHSPREQNDWQTPVKTLPSLAGGKMYGHKENQKQVISSFLLYQWLIRVIDNLS